MILNLDHFVDAANDAVGEQAGTLEMLTEFSRLAVSFEGPRVFQFYTYLHGFIAIGAMGFTLGRMHVHKELIAIMASGVSLMRVALPLIVMVVAVSVVQLLNQELILPRVAPLLLRDHDQIGEKSVDEFPVRFIEDGEGGLLHAARYVPDEQVLRYPTILKRDDKGRTIRRISADRAKWDESKQTWNLTNGREARLPLEDGPESGSVMRRRPIDQYQSDITPEVLTVKHFTQFASMLSMSQIRRMLESPAVANDESLQRHWYARFATIPINALVLLITLPSFLLREPRNLLVQSMKCAALAIPALIGAAVGMMLDLPGIAPVVGVFLPVIVLLPIAMARLTVIRT